MRAARRHVLLVGSAGERTGARLASCSTLALICMRRYPALEPTLNLVPQIQVGVELVDGERPKRVGGMRPFECDPSAKRLVVKRLTPEIVRHILQLVDPFTNAERRRPVRGRRRQILGHPRALPVPPLAPREKDYHAVCPRPGDATHAVESARPVDWVRLREARQHKGQHLKDGIDLEEERVKRERVQRRELAHRIHDAIEEDGGGQQHSLDKWRPPAVPVIDQPSTLTVHELRSYVVGEDARPLDLPLGARKGEPAGEERRVRVRRCVRHHEQEELDIWYGKPEEPCRVRAKVDTELKQ
eukprot:scaffold155439_cov31-Tisochrysis_lutea.AAC.1